jgi:transmembrane sensor
MGALSDPDETQIAAEATRWFEALRHEVPDAGLRADFARWLKRSPRNVQHFLFATALDRTLDSLDARRELDVEAMIAEAGNDVVALRAEVHSPEPVARQMYPHRRGQRLAGIAATFAVAVTGWWVFANIDRPQVFTTAIGEQRTIRLEDGSVLQLNTDSRVRVQFSDDGRDLALLKGEALFKVAHGAARPFRVRAGDSLIQALGTQFNVYRKPGGVAVAVLEGKVAVSARDKRAAYESGEAQATVLAAGETATVTAGTVIREHLDEAAHAAAWRQRRLVFRIDPLSEVIAEFNRYNRAPKLRLEGMDGAARHYTGTFDADDPDSLALLLSQDSTLSVERSEQEIVIRPR